MDLEEDWVEGVSLIVGLGLWWLGMTRTEAVQPLRFLLREAWWWLSNDDMLVTQAKITAEFVSKSTNLKISIHFLRKLANYLEFFYNISFLARLKSYKSDCLNHKNWRLIERCDSLQIKTTRNRKLIRDVWYENLTLIFQLLPWRKDHYIKTFLIHELGYFHPASGPSEFRCIQKGDYQSPWPVWSDIVEYNK